MLRSRQHEAPHGGALIDLDLQVAQQLRGVLDLVEDRPPRMLREEGPRVAARIVAHVEQLEGNVGLVGKERATERRLARFTRSGDRDDGLDLCRILERSRKVTLNHWSMGSSGWSFRQLD